MNRSYMLPNKDASYLKNINYFLNNVINVSITEFKNILMIKLD